MFLLAALPEVLLLLSWVWRSDGLCSPTRFYKNCWIQRFPQLTVDLEQSEQRGARVLKVYAEPTAKQCSRTCCLLKNLSCNMAIFYYKPNIQDKNCMHIYCPGLERCIMKPSGTGVLYSITPGETGVSIGRKHANAHIYVNDEGWAPFAGKYWRGFSLGDGDVPEKAASVKTHVCDHLKEGVDPDLLVFEDLSFRSTSNTGERHTGRQVADPETYQDAPTFPRYLFPRRRSPSTTAETLAADRSSRRLVTDAPNRTAVITSTVLLASATNRSPKAAEIILEKRSSTTTLDNATPFPSSVLTPTKRLPLLPSVALLNDSKVYSVRNRTSDDDGQQPSWQTREKGTWLPLGVLSSLLALTCSCSICFMTGYYRRKRGDYQPKSLIVPTICKRYRRKN